MIKNQLTRSREARGLRKSQLAYYARVNRSSITKLEQGALTPSLELALRIARCLKTPIEEIFQLVEDGRPSLSRPCSASVGNQSNAEINNRK